MIMRSIVVGFTAFTLFGCAKAGETTAASTPTSASSPTPGATPVSLPTATPGATAIPNMPTDGAGKVDSNGNNVKDKPSTPVIPGAPQDGAGKVNPVGSNAKNCGTKTDDWCAAPAGDACGVHKNVAACKADKKCKGMRYTGESLVACKDDGTGFTSNCPTVGCISR